MRRAGITLFFLLTIGAASAANDLTGVVVDGSRKPLPGATVFVYTAFPKIGISPFCPSCYRDCGKHVSVDGAGEFRLNDLDPSLRFDLLVVADGYEPSFARQTDPASGPVTIQLRPRSLADADRMIIGKIIDPQGKPVVGATVTPNGYRFNGHVIYGGFPGVDQLSFTNAQGEFALRIPVAAAKLDVLVTARNLAPHIERMLAPGQALTIPLIDGATIFGHVLRDGKPLAGAQVGFVQSNRASSDFLGHLEIGTNEDGLFVMTNMGPNERYTVYTPMDTSPAGVATPKTVRAGDDKSSTDTGNLVAGPGRRIAGRIVLPSRASIPPHTQIMVLAANGSDARSAEVGSDGTFSFAGVPRGVTELSMNIPGLDLVSSTPHASDVVLASDGDVADACLEFERPRPNAPVMNLASTRLTRVTDSGNVIQAALAPDAKHTAYVTSDKDQQTLMVRDMATGKTETLIAARPVAYWGMTFTPDSSSVYFGARDSANPGGAIYQISRQGGQPRKIIESIDSQPAFSPDGKHMVFLRAGFPTSDESAVLMANADGTGLRTLASIHAPDLFAPIFFAGASWSPDGTLVATSVMRVEKDASQRTGPVLARIVTIDVATGSMKTIVDHGFAVAAQVAWMPDQKGLVAIASSSGRNGQVWYVPYPSGQPQLITRDVLNYRTVSLSADGKSLLTVAADGTGGSLSRDALLIMGFRPAAPESFSPPSAIGKKTSGF